MSRVATLVYDDALEVGADVAALVGIEQFGGLLYQRQRLWEHVARVGRKAGFTHRIHLRDGSDRLALWEEIGAMRAMHGDDGDPMRVAPLPRDPEFLLELPEYVELIELHANSWTSP